MARFVQYIVPMKILLLSDTHLREGLPSLPPADVILHAGDLTMTGTLPEVEQAMAWAAGLDCAKFIFTPGNHDWLFQRDAYLAKAILKGCGGRLVSLVDESYLYEGLTFYGTPWQPYFQNWAFNLQRVDMQRIWKKVPNGVDVLLTHCPPEGIMDLVPRGTHEGCEFLRRELPRIKPRLHVFGHVHEGYGSMGEVKDCPGTLFVNASVCDGRYKPINTPMEVEL